MKPLSWMLLAGGVAATLGLQLFGPAHPHPQSWDTIPLFYGACGFIGAVALIVVARALARLMLKKPEDYYDRDS